MVTSSETTDGRATLAAGLATAAAALFLLLLAALHIVRTDLEPSCHMISEYEVGHAGWMMSASFAVLAAAFLALSRALKPFVEGRLGSFGRLLLLLSAIGAGMGGLFPPDPASQPRDQATLSGVLHGVSFLVGVPGTLFGVTLLNLRLWRHPFWRSARPMLLGTLTLVWLTLIVFGISMVAMAKRAPGPEFLVGWQNRAVVISWALWVIAMSQRARA